MLQIQVETLNKNLIKGGCYLWQLRKQILRNNNT